MNEKMSYTIDSYESIDKENELAEFIKWQKLEESELAGNVIKSLDSNKWSSIVEKELMSNGKWLTYGEMKSKQFYPFLVQSSIDLISNKLVEYRYMLENPEVEMKFDENWNQTSDWKTLKQMLSEKWWIDNNYGWGTHKLVRIVQNILWIHSDGLAGPQYFANVKAFLLWESLSRFVVKWVDGYAFSDVSERVAVKEKIVTDLKEIPTAIKDFKYDKYIYTSWWAKYIFHKEAWKVEKESKNRETGEVTVELLTALQVKNQFGINIEQEQSLDLKDLNIFKIDSEPMKSILETVEQKNLWKWHLHPVGTDISINEIVFVSTNGLNDYNNYITFRYNYGTGEIVKEVKYFNYDFLTNSSEMDLPVSNLKDVWWKDHKLFVNLATEYNKVWRDHKDTGMYNKTMKDKAIEKAWPWLVDLIWNWDARDLTERITNKKNWKAYRKRVKEQSTLGNKHTTLKDWLIYRSIFRESIRDKLKQDRLKVEKSL